MDKNRYIIAAAGSGKTTYIVHDALARQGKALLLTYTDSNKREIEDKVITEKGCVPANITIMTWFSFLIKYGVKPYQGALYPEFTNLKVKGLILCKTGHEGRLRQVVKGKEIWNPYKESDHPVKHYCSRDFKLYSDRIAKFVVKTNEKVKGRLINRLALIFPYIYIDEVQDLAGYDLDILKLLFASSSNITLVGDPRQYVYSTHRESHFRKYSEGRVKEFILAECSKKRNKQNNCEIDEQTLCRSHRNSKTICALSSFLYQGLYEPTKPCDCKKCSQRKMNGTILAIRRKDLESVFKDNPEAIQLRYNASSNIANLKAPVLNFGVSKGLTFDTVIIYPTSDMKAWLRGFKKSLPTTTKAKLYVAITRARRNVYFVFDNGEELPDITSMFLTANSPLLDVSTEGHS